MHETDGPTSSVCSSLENPVQKAVTYLENSGNNTMVYVHVITCVYTTTHKQRNVGKFPGKAPSMQHDYT